MAPGNQLDGGWCPPGSLSGTGKPPACLNLLNWFIAVLHADTQHFWPYWLNQDSEATSGDDYAANSKIVAAIRSDMGL